MVSSIFDYGVMRQFFLLQELPEEEQIDRQPYYEMNDACAWLDLPLAHEAPGPLSMGG